MPTPNVGPCEGLLILLWLDTLYWTDFGLLKNNTHYKAWKSQDIFKYNSNWIRLKKESHIHLGLIEGE